MEERGGRSQEPSGSTYPCEAVPRPGWEVAADFGLSCLQHRRDEQPPAPQELAVHGPGVGVFGEPGEGRRAAVQPQSIAPLPAPVAALTRGRAAAPPSPQRREPGGRGCRGRAGGSSGGGGLSSWHPGQPG